MARNSAEISGLEGNRGRPCTWGLSEREKDQSDIVGSYCQPGFSLSQDDCDPIRMRGSTRLKGSGSSLTLYVDSDPRYGAGRGGTGGTGDSRPAGVAGLNQNDDFDGIDEFDARFG